MMQAMGHPRFRRTIAFFILSVLMSGCQRTLDSDYAIPRGPSINGISSFVQLLKRTDRKVDVWLAIAPPMHSNYGTLVVFHSGFGQLSTESLKRLSEFVDRKSIRTLMIVVRDSDLAIDYWRQIGEQPTITAAVKDEASRAQNRAFTSLNSNADSEFDATKGKWYGLKRVDRSTDALSKSIVVKSGSDPISITARWPLNRRLVASESAEVLWDSGDDPLLTLEKRPSVSIYVLAAATPLLNGGLVDPGNRNLAVEFVRLIPETDRVAVSATSEWFGESNLGSPSIWRFLNVHPNGWVFGQAIFAILLFCWWKMPIFGRPKITIETQTARFGRHVDALGILMRRTRNIEFARQKIREWCGRDTSGSEPSSRPD